MTEWNYIGGGEKDLYECSYGCGAKRLPGVLLDEHTAQCDIWLTSWQCGCTDGPVPDDKSCPQCGYNPDDY